MLLRYFRLPVQRILGPLATDLDASFVNAPACGARSAPLPAQAFLKIVGVGLDPAIDRGMVDRNAALAHHLFEINGRSPRSGSTSALPRARSRLQNGVP
jgi:hypothetical protein